MEVLGSFPAAWVLIMRWVVFLVDSSFHKHRSYIGRSSKQYSPQQLASDRCCMIRVENQMIGKVPSHAFLDNLGFGNCCGCGVTAWCSATGRSSVLPTPTENEPRFLLLPGQLLHRWPFD